MTTKEAKKLYKKATYKPRYSRTCWQVRNKWNITMLGKLSWMIPGNQKIIDEDTRGHNTKFNGNFYIVWHRKCWKLVYDPYHSTMGHIMWLRTDNSWWVRRIMDKVRFVNIDLAIGRFYYCGVPLGWFVMKRSSK